MKIYCINKIILNSHRTKDLSVQKMKLYPNKMFNYNYKLRKSKNL